jgi:hypothetical protein
MAGLVRSICSELATGARATRCAARGHGCGHGWTRACKQVHERAHAHAACATMAGDGNVRSVVLVSSEVEIFQRLQLVDRSWNFPREIVGVHRKDLRIGGAPDAPEIRVGTHEQSARQWRTFSFFKLPMAAGMPPLSLFRLRTSDSRLVRVPISATSVPDTSRRIDIGRCTRIGDFGRTSQRSPGKV